MNLGDFLGGKIGWSQDLIYPGNASQGHTPMLGDPNLIIKIRSVSYDSSSTWRMDKYLFYAFKPLVVGWEHVPVDERPITYESNALSNPHGYDLHAGFTPTSAFVVAWWYKTNNKYGFAIIKFGDEVGHSEYLTNDGSHVTITDHTDGSITWNSPDCFGSNTPNFNVAYYNNGTARPPTGPVTEFLVIFGKFGPVDPGQVPLIPAFDGPDLDTLPEPPPTGGP